MRFIVRRKCAQQTIAYLSLDESSWPMRILHGVQDQDHNVIIVKSVVRQSEGAGRGKETTVLLTFVVSEGHTIHHSLSRNS